MHLSSSDKVVAWIGTVGGCNLCDEVVAWSGVQWGDVTCAMNVLCNSKTFTLLFWGERPAVTQDTRG